MVKGEGSLSKGCDEATATTALQTERRLSGRASLLGLCAWRPDLAGFLVKLCDQEYAFDNGTYSFFGSQSLSKSYTAILLQISSSF